MMPGTYGAVLDTDLVDLLLILFLMIIIDGTGTERCPSYCRQLFGDKGLKAVSLQHTGYKLQRFPGVGCIVLQLYYRN